MITLGQRWMNKLRVWVQGVKHPNTPKTVFKNVYEYDRVRRILHGRCTVCNCVISSDAQAVREIIFTCGRVTCECKNALGSKAHEVCDVCEAMFRALYTNYGLENHNYFREIDEREKRDIDDARRKGGL